MLMKDKGIILQINAHCTRIIAKTEKMEKSYFFADLDIREIICFNLFQIGELAKKLSDDFISRYNQIPWKYIKGMRDHIVHGYDTLNLEIVWNTVLESIPQLKSYCDEILREEEKENDTCN